jgi:PAS domain S-box-containing protein
MDAPSHGILLLAADERLREEVRAVLERAGFVVTVASTLEEALAAAPARHPELLLFAPAPTAQAAEGVAKGGLSPEGRPAGGLSPEGRSPDGGPVRSVVRALREVGSVGDLPLVVIAGRDDDRDVEEAFAEGADDVLRLPLRAQELLARVRAQLRLRRYVEELARKEHDAQVMAELTRTLASSLDFREILYTVVRRIADVVRVDRVSIVLSPEEGGVGFVVAASDDEQVSNLRIDLAKYPEIQQVLRTREPLTIADAATHPVLDGVRADVARARLSSLSLFPIVWEDAAMGVLFLRWAAPRGALGERELGFCRVVANATAVALRNARVLQSLRDQTQQITFARFEAERRLRSLKRYADYFASAADGLAAVDTEGRLLFGNPRAFELIGLGEDAVLGKKLREFVHEDDVASVRALFAGFSRGEYPRGVDVRVRRGDGALRVMSLSFSPLLDGEGAVLFSFRDVTEERETAAELVKTKEFLQSLIEASVDPIVASDMKGTIILYNKAAERVYGWTAEEVVGKASARLLYPPGGAEAVMRMIRSPQHGGVGKLDNVRTDAIDRAGNIIPISLSASLVYEGGVPVATFGIFTDLREKLRVEERLAQAQQKLAVTEKQALIAELAGTAAHELNQPLQSVMVYAEMLIRKTEGRQEQTYAKTILSEAERMKDIVRKIGKITKYETKTYVGTQRILDLDKSSGESDLARRMSSRPPAPGETAPGSVPAVVISTVPPPPGGKGGPT